MIYRTLNSLAFVIAENYVLTQIVRMRDRQIDKRSHTKIDTHTEVWTWLKRLD